MKVATYYNNKDIRIEERPVPVISGGEILVKTRAAGICGSDVAEWYRLGKVGRVLGHEIAGEVVEVGAGVKHLKKGDRVAASHHVPCFYCHYCRLGHHTLCDTLRTTNFDPGGFAEWIRLPELNVRYGVYPLKEVSYDEGTFVEPLACTLRAQRKANLRPEQTLLVIGSGISGLLHLQLARVRGIHKIIAVDIQDYRLRAAKKFGADFVFSAAEDVAEKIREVNEGRLADVVIVCAGKKPAAEQALQCVERGGTVLFFALNSPDQQILLSPYEIFWQKGATLMNSYAASPKDHRESLAIIRSGKIHLKEMISHHLPFDEIAKGFDLVSKAENSLKIIIHI